MTTPQMARAETPTCPDVLNACDAALKAKQRELDLADLGIKIRDEDRLRLQKENAALRERGSAWYENPVVWAAIGVIAGSYIGARATR
jgi:hypothetical protein